MGGRAAAAALWLLALATRGADAVTPALKKGSASPKRTPAGQNATSSGAANASSDVTKGGWHLCATPLPSVPILAGTAAPAGTIPRILHQTYKTKDLPPNFRRYRETWLEQLPEWKHRLWQDYENRALIEAHYPWFLETFNSLDHIIKRVDVAKIFILHRFGGVYADLDVQAIRDPTPLFAGGHDLVMFYQLPPRQSDGTVERLDAAHPKLGTVGNALMASRPGHPFWLFLAERIMKSSVEALELNSDIQNMDIFWATGSSIVSAALADFQQEHPEEKVAIFSKKYWAPFAWGQKDDPCEADWECKAVYPDAYLISHWTMSWNLCHPGTHSANCKLQLSLLQADSSVVGESYAPWCT